MTQPVLTIAIPTYNRAYHLDRQLEWAVRSIAERWDQVELIVSDNGSRDATPEICARWQQRTNGQLRVFRHPSNLGLTLNALYCIQQASGQYVWLVSDDDEVMNHTFDWVLQALSIHSDKNLSLIHLNGIMKSKQGEVLAESIYTFRRDRLEKPGILLFQECSRQSNLFIGLTWSIYLTQAAKRAIEYWSGIKNNLAFPVFLAGYTASQGSMLVRAEPSVAFIDGTTSFQSIWPVVDFYLLPEVYIKLSELGYHKEFIRAKILSNLSLIRFVIKFPIQSIRSIRLYIKAFRLKKN